jgi:hypothetical protein
MIFVWVHESQFRKDRLHCSYWKDQIVNFGQGRKSVMSSPHLVASRLRQSGQKTYLAILLWSLQQWTNFESISYYFSLIDPLPMIWNQFFYSGKSLCGKKIAIFKHVFFSIGYGKTFAIWIPFCLGAIFSFLQMAFFLPYQLLPD